MQDNAELKYKIDEDDYLPATYFYVDGENLSRLIFKAIWEYVACFDCKNEAVKPEDHEEKWVMKFKVDAPVAE